jgi:hypothetical protein
LLYGGDEAGKRARLVSGSSGGDAGECGLQAERGERLAGPGWERGALGLAGNLGRAWEGVGAWAVRGKGKEEGWAGRV